MTRSFSLSGIQNFRIRRMSTSYTIITVYNLVFNLCVCDFVALGYCLIGDIIIINPPISVLSGVEIHSCRTEGGMVVANVGDCH